MKKISCCILCRNFRFDPGYPALSELTGGMEWSMMCLKNHWSMSGYDVTEEEYRKNMLKAEDCKDAEEVE